MAYGLWLMAYGLWLMAYGLWLMAYGVNQTRPQAISHKLQAVLGQKVRDVGVVAAIFEIS